MPDMLRTLKVRLKTPLKAAVRLRRAMGCARFVHNFLLFETKSDYGDFLDELESRQCFGEALSRKEAEALCVRPEPVSKFSFNYRLRQLKELYPFLTADTHSQVLQQECQRLSGAYRRFFEGKGGYPRFKRKGETESIRYPQYVRLDLKRRQLFLPKLGWLNIFNKEMPVTPEQAEGIHAATVVREGDRFFACMEYRVSVPETLSAEALAEDLAGMDRGVTVPLMLSDGTQYGTELKDRIQPLAERIKLLQKRFRHKTGGSGTRRALRKQIAKLHLKIRSIHRDILHKATAEICKNRVCISMEDLKLKHMTDLQKAPRRDPAPALRPKPALTVSSFSGP